MKYSEIKWKAVFRVTTTLVTRVTSFAGCRLAVMLVETEGDTPENGVSARIAEPRHVIRYASLSTFQGPELVHYIVKCHANISDRTQLERASLSRPVHIELSETDSART